MNSIRDASTYIELNLQESGQEVCVPDKVFNFTPKRYHLFHYVYQGKGTLEYKGITYQVKAGQLFYIAPGDMPFYKPDPDDPWCYVWLGFDGSNAKRFLFSAGLSSSTPIYNDPSRELKSLFIAIDDQKKTKGYYDLFCLGYAYQLFCLMSDDEEESASKDISAKKRHVDEAKEFIKNNYAFNIGVTDIAKSVGVTTNYLANIFKEVDNSSPKKYLTQVRMERAASLLKTQQYRIGEVASMVSYKNQLHFSNVFKQYYGISPGEFMKKGDK